MSTGEEIAKYNLTHQPYRPCCKYCAMGRLDDTHHHRHKQAREPPIVSIDYMCVGDGSSSSPTFVACGGVRGNRLAIPVASKGAIGLVSEKLSEWMANVGHAKIIIKRDQEPAIVEVHDAIPRERANDLRAIMKNTAAIRGFNDQMQILPENPPVGQSQSNGVVENSIKQAQGQIRTFEVSNEERHAEEDRAC